MRAPSVAVNYSNIARKVLKELRKTKPSREEIKTLSDKMILLDQRGLGKLNQRLLDGGRNIQDTFAELNFAIILASHLLPATPISYEPDGLQRPIDFKIAIGHADYWVQMKHPSVLKRQNMQNKMIQKIEKEAKKIKVGKIFACDISSDFNEESIPDLMGFMKREALSAIEGKTYIFTGENNQKAEIEFYLLNKKSSCLKLGIRGDLDMVKITGESKDQIKASLSNAAGAFEWETDDKNINLIAMEADNIRNSNICDALFGTEFFLLNNQGSAGWRREEDGWFKEPGNSKKVAGIIAIKKKRGERQTPVSDYSVNLFINDGFKHLLEPIKGLIRIDNVVSYNMSPMKGGNF